MLWVIRSHIRVNRAATGWLVHRLVDPEARFRFVEPVEVSRMVEELRTAQSRQRALRLGAFDTISLVGQAGGPAWLRERLGR